MAKIRRKQNEVEARNSVIAMLARHPDNLAHAYGVAARLVAEAELNRESGGVGGVRLDMPALYLIRHTVELSLKDLLRSYHQNQVEQNQLDKASGNALCGTPLSEAEQKTAGGTHDLRQLFDLVGKYLASYMSPTWKRLVDAIVSIEGEHVEFSRFDEAKMDKTAIHEGHPRWHYEFVRPIDISLTELVADLDVFLKEAVILNWKDLEKQRDWSALQDLALEGEALQSKLGQLGIDEDG